MTLTESETEPPPTPSTPTAGAAWGFRDADGCDSEIWYSGVCFIEKRELTSLVEIKVLLHDL